MSTRLITAGEGGRLTQAQILRLVTAIEPAHVENKRGMSYMAQFEVRAELTRIFGFGNWDSEVEVMECLYEMPLREGDEQFPNSAKDKSKTYWIAAYRAAVRLTIRDYWGREVCSFLEYHVEENAPLPNRGEAHAMAMTSVESYALRRAAIGLGDRLGLGLYDKGSTAPLVMRTLQLDDPESPTYYNPQTGQQPPMQAPPAPPAQAQIGSPDAAGALSRPAQRRLEGFKDAQATVQAGNQAAREAAPVDPYMERAAAGMKYDERDAMGGSYGG